MTTQRASVAFDHLSELAEILKEEELALRKMDAGRVLSLSERKLEWMERNGGRELETSPAAVDLLRAMRERALKNQLLLVHARDLLQGMIEAQGGVRAMGCRDGRARLLEVKG